MVADDLRARGAGAVHTAAADLNDAGARARVVTDASKVLPSFDHVLVAHGVLPDQAIAEQEIGSAEQALEVNFVSPAALCLLVAPILERQGRGMLAVIGSVAGDRGRASNYIYGAGKGGLAVFLAGLRIRLAKRGVAVLTIKPGFVDTPMTASFRKGPLFASAATVGRGIQRAMAGGRSGTLYLPFFWRWIMLIIRLMPEPIFRRLPL